MAMTLPPLPQQNKHKESDFGLLFRHWLMKNPTYTATFELKCANDNDVLPFCSVTDEQINYALAVNSDKGVLMRTEGVRGMPDYTYLRNERSYFVIKFKKCFVFIGPKCWQKEKQNSKRKSLTSARAKIISHLTINL
jgi:hypothetical protein